MLNLRKSSWTLGIIVSQILVFGMIGTAVGAPYGAEGTDIDWVQPDGKRVHLKVFGDEFYARTETWDGRTVVYEANDQAYYYAKLSADGHSLLSSGRKAVGHAPADIVKHLRLRADAVQKIRGERLQRYAPDRAGRWAKKVRAARQRRAAGNQPAVEAEAANRNTAPSGAEAMDGPAAASAPELALTVGAKIGLTIIAQFPDDPETTTVDPVNFPTTRTKIERYCNETGYTDDGNTGSVRDYFWDQSLNLLTYTQLVTQVVTLPHPRNYYNFSNYPTNTLLRDAGATGRLVIADAIAELQSAGFDFSSLTVDGGNNVIATNVLFAGNNSGVWSEGLWPHSWVMSPSINVGTGANPINIYRYQITNAANASPTIGTFAHENGHMLLGFPDLYDYGGESEGVGEHCLMGSGNHLNGGKTPAPLNAYFKDISGWGANIVDITPASYVNTNLPTTDNHAYRIRKAGSSTEYFIVENRGAGDRWAQSCRDKGIAIWHVDEAVNGNNNEQMTASLHYEVSLEQADGVFDLENDRDRGDAFDLYDSTTQGFNDGTTPNAAWWDGSASGINISILSTPGASMNVEFGIGNSVTVNSPNGSESIYQGANQTITWLGNITGNVKIELHKAGVLHTVLSADETNDGSYDWLVDTGLPVGDDYSIRVSSVADPGVDDLSDGYFSIKAEVFPVGGVMPSGWAASAGANAGWEVTTADASEGLSSIRSVAIGDNETAAIEYSADFQEGNVSFDVRVSSQNGQGGIDLMRFFIDGVEQDLDPGSSELGLAGEVAWANHSFTIPAGVHILKWEYVKDARKSGGSDAVWVDGVELPPLALSPYEAWQLTHFGPDASNPLVSADTLDSDGDGLQNLTEYALGTDPLIKNTQSVMQVEAQGNEVSITYTRNLLATDVAITFEKSNDVGSADAWAPAAVAEQVIGTNGDLETVTATHTYSGTDRIFLRMKTSHTGP